MREFITKRIGAVVGMSALIAGGATACGLAIFASSASAELVNITPSNPVEATVEQAENAYLAVFSPVATNPAQSSSCSAAKCTLSEAPPTTPISAFYLFSDNSQLSAGSGEAAIALSTSNPRFNLQLANERNATVINSVFAPNIGANVEQVARNILSGEASRFSSRDQCAHADCTIIGAAGAVVTKFSDEKIGESTATLTANVIDWQDNAPSTGNPAGKLSWTRIQSTIIVQETLEKQVDGSWKISAREWDFAPGETS